MTCASRAVSVGVLIVCALGLARGSNAATITVNPPDAYGRIFVDVVGDILLEDDKTFQAKIGRPVDPEKVIITLVGDGGDALTAGAIGDIIRLTGMNTFVPVGQRCASACAFIWLAGAERFISSNAYVGFHGIYDPRTGQQPAMPNILMATYLGYLGFGYGAVVWMLSPRPLAIHWLTAETAKQYGIYTQSLNPPRTIPLAQPAGPPQAPLPSNPPHPDQELKRDLYLGCTPVVIGDEPDPVTDIFVWLTVWSQGDKPQISYFDAWHHTATGNTYKRSEQYEYVNRHYEISNVHEQEWIWDGRLARDRNIYMIGQLALAANGIYTYKERIFHGDPGPKSRSEEVTNSVCKQIRAIPNWSNEARRGGNVQGAPEANYVDPQTIPYIIMPR